MNTPTGRKRFAKRSLGQNFLVDPNSIRKIIEALDLSENETVVEIGPGRGALTEHLVDSGANVIAIELDRDLVPQLRDRFSAEANFQIIEADAIDVNFRSLLTNVSPPVKIVANLPYYISTAILQRLITERELFSSLVLMFQREVVDRITAKPGSSDRGYLTVLAEMAFEIERLFDVSPGCFRPIPKVWSSVVRLRPKLAGIVDDGRVRTMLSSAFAQKRKTIVNSLKASLPNAKTSIMAAGIEPSRRAESLSLDEWRSLFDTIYPQSTH